MCGKGLQSNSALDRRFRISVDTGGTFTDVVISDCTGEMSVGKSFTTYRRIFDGFSSAVADAADHWGLCANDVLKKADTIIYATTHATNAVVTARTAKTALLITEGFEDTLTYREGGRLGGFNARARYPGPFIPRDLTFGVAERISAEGEIMEQLSENELDRLATHLASRDVEAVAVMLLWSIVNPDHELRLADMLRSKLPHIPFSLSHEVNPIIREYRRASSVAIDASLKPLMKLHFSGLAEDLNNAGFAGSCLVVTSEGGVQTLESVAAKPILAVNSGPSMAPLAGASFADSTDDVVVCDIGGTTFDVSLVEGGRLRHTRELWLGEPFIGELAGLASVSVKSVGAGGGSIARIDPGGLLKVGPDSAGSSPGPAAYCKGGTKPTITDAAVVLGYLDPEAVAEKFVLSPEKARQSIESDIANPLNMTVEQASAAILHVAATQSALAAHQAILEQGVDPRGIVLVACGGAGPLLGCFVAEELEASKVIVPNNAGVLAAYGAHNADIVTEFNIPVTVLSSSPSVGRLEQAIAELRAKVNAFVSQFGAEEKDIGIQYYTEARYSGQGWEIRVMLGYEIFASEWQIEQAVDRFHQEHFKRNGVSDPGSDIEFLAWGVRASISREKRTPGPQLHNPKLGVESKLAAATFGGTSYPTPRYKGLTLSEGWQAEGPLVIDDPTTTVVVPPDWTVRRVSDGSYHIRKIGMKGNADERDRI